MYQRTSVFPSRAHPTLLTVTESSDSRLLYFEKCTRRFTTTFEAQKSPTGIWQDLHHKIVAVAVLDLSYTLHCGNIFILALCQLA